MTDNQSPNRRMVPRSGGFFSDLADRFRLVGRLMMDSRVNPFLKILPVGTLVYVFWPVDLLPVNPVDDAFIIWAGTNLFVELCPPDVVEEHLQALNKVIAAQWKSKTGGHPGSMGGQQEGDVIDGEYYESEATSGKNQSPPR